ncbi:MAG: tetratricopeptide repeat protein [Deltaproteobacteria bacterium]|nr:tetratricopeptide repeat protein [Deltaproteobacteria bacterium]
MNIKQAFHDQKYLEIVNTSDNLISSEDRLMLGISLYRLGRYDEALRVLNKISVEAQELVKSLFFMGKIYQQKGDMDAAKQCIQRYLVFYPDDDEAYDVIQAPQDVADMISMPSKELAQLYAQQGHLEQALDIYANLLKDSPEANIRDIALETQNIFIERTLEQWLERVCE